MAGRNSAHIVEVEPSGLRWVKSSASQAEGTCVEIAAAADVVVVRCSRHRIGPRLTVPVANWAAFLATLR